MSVGTDGNQEKERTLEWWGRGEIEADGSHDAERTNQQAALSRYAVMAAGHRPI